MTCDEEKQIDLEDILITEELIHRLPKTPNLQAENQAMHTLARQLASSPQTMLKTLVTMARDLCKAGTAGVSLLETNKSGGKVFRLVALTGELEQYEMMEAPVNFSPCGVCLERGAPQLYSYPARYFTYFQQAKPLTVESLVIPLVVDEQPLGTIWIVSHNEQQHFDSEDVRIMTSLADFTAAALRSSQARQEAELAKVALQQSEAQMQSLIANMPGMVYRYIPCNDAFKQFSFVSSGCRDLFEVEAQVALQDAGSIWNLIHPDDLASFTASVGAAIENFLPWDWQGRITTPSGKLKWIQGRSSALQVEDQEVWDGLLIDITERKLIEIEREQILQREQDAREAAEIANRIKDEFLAVLSHELRSPLNPILGWSNLLRKGKLDAAKTAYGLETIERNAKLQVQLIEDLLDVSRILRGKLSLNMAPQNLVSIITAAMETVQLAAKAKSIQVDKIFDSDVVQILGDSARLQQIVWNLISNAVKFTPFGGSVKIQLNKLDKEAQIQVIDNGKGISLEFLPYVFEYFRQADSTTTRTFGGLGLGLAIVRHLVELHGGTVKAESPGVGQGATFTVKLPLLKPENSKSVELESTLSSSIHPCLPLVGMRILLVDDEKDTRELIAFILEQSGAVVTSVENAVQAIQAFEQESFDMLLSDIGMPRMDGYALIQRIREIASKQSTKIVAVALTAYAGEINQQQALTAGFQRHVSKPVEPQHLINVILDLRLYMHQNI